MVARTLTCILFFVALLYACGNKTGGEQAKSCTKPQTAVTNPNGMSEMSLIMEEWYAQLAQYAEQLNAGKKIEGFLPLDEKSIYTAGVSKEKDNVHGEQFDAFTESFFYNYNNTGRAATYEEQVQHFNLAVKACINCHEQHCQGPIVRIKKLTVANKKIE